MNRLAPMPNVLPPPLLSRERQQYLFNNIWEYIQEDERDVVCPKTLLSWDVLKHGSQGLKKTVTVSTFFFLHFQFCRPDITTLVDWA